MRGESLRDFERTIYAAWWEDGVLDLFVGAGLGLIGIAWLSDLMVMGAIVPALLVPLWQPVRTRLVEPRRGYVEFSDRRQSNMRHFVWALLLAGGIALMLVIGAYFNLTLEGHRSWIAGLPCLLLALPAFAVAVHTGRWRFAAYGVGLLACALMAVLLAVHPGFSILAGGVLPMVTGIVLLTRFMSAHTEAQEAGPDDGVRN